MVPNPIICLANLICSLYPNLEFSEFKILKQDENMKMSPRVHKEVPVIPVEYHVKTSELNRG